MKWIKKVTSTPLTNIAKVIDSLSAQLNDRINAPSIRATREGIAGVSDRVESLGDTLSSNIESVAGDLIETNQNLSTLSTNTTAALATKTDKTMIGDAYSSSATYAVGDYCIYNNTFYRCKTAVLVPESFDAAKWDASTVAEYLEPSATCETLEATANFVLSEDAQVSRYGKMVTVHGSVRNGTEATQAGEITSFEFPAPISATSLYIYAPGNNGSGTALLLSKDHDNPQIAYLSSNGMNTGYTQYYFDFTYMSV